MRIEDVVDKHGARLRSLANVVGVAITERDGEEAILVLVAQKVPEEDLAPSDVVPREIEGFRTVVELEPRVGG